MIRRDQALFRFGELIFSYPPFNFLKGIFGAYCLYPLAERHEKRNVNSKLANLRRHYRLTLDERMTMAKNSLVETLLFAGHKVPYYRDLFKQLNFDPEMVCRDPRYLEKLPYLDKKIILEQGDRLLSQPLSEVRHHLRKTGGSTGQSAFIYYDQAGLDCSSAVVLYARERIGKQKYKSELHFACKFADHGPSSWPTREDLKCLAMNRSNIFFDRIDDAGLELMWRVLRRRRPYLIHGHPSTIYALACYIERQYGSAKAFEIFESSGELLQPYMREKISQALCCRVIDRYGLAELGVMAYEMDGPQHGLQVLESEGWPESRPTSDDENELVFTGFRNRLMPLIRYATGDRGQVVESDRGFVLTNVVGRIHDIVPINGVAHPTHHIMDVLDHRVGGIQEFQIDLRAEHPILRIVLAKGANQGEVSSKIEHYWPGAFKVEFVGHDSFIYVGHRAKFRHVVTG